MIDFNNNTFWIDDDGMVRTKEDYEAWSSQKSISVQELHEIINAPDGLIDEHIVTDHPPMTDENGLLYPAALRELPFLYIVIGAFMIWGVVSALIAMGDALGGIK